VTAGPINVAVGDVDHSAANLATTGATSSLSSSARASSLARLAWLARRAAARIRLRISRTVEDIIEKPLSFSVGSNDPTALRARCAQRDNVLIASMLQNTGDYDEEPSSGCRSTCVTLSPASAKTMACTDENFTKMMDRMSTMPYGLKRMAMTREMAVVNTDLSNGDLRGACKHYVIAQRIQNNVRDPFENLHFE
jgi:hypothetical protein